MPKNPVRDDRTLTVGEIANLGRVQPSAVSNWRKRHADFPLPALSSAGADVFDYDSVLVWLTAHGKLHQTQQHDIEQELWFITERIRGFVPIGDAALVTLQAIHLRQLADTTSPESAAVPHFWEGLQEFASLGDAWRQTVKTISSLNPQLAALLELPPNLPDEAIRDLLFTVHRAHNHNLVWGDITTKLLQRYTAFGGAQHFPSATPESVMELAASLLEPAGEEIYDAACGQAMVLAACWRRAGRRLRLVGQELHERSWQVGYLHLAILGATFELYNGDTLLADRVRGRNFSRVIIDPPAGIRIDTRSLLGDNRWVYGIPRGSADWLWPQHALAHLSETGVGIVMLPLGALARTQHDIQIRRAMLEADTIDAIIELPPGLWPGMSVSMALLILTRARANRRRRVLFIDGRRMGTLRRGQMRQLESQEIQRITNVITKWRRGDAASEPRLAGTSTVAQILANDADLSPSLYVEYEADRISTIDGEAIPRRMERLTDRLSRVAAQPTTNATSENAGFADIIASLVRGAREITAIEADAWPQVELGALLTIPPRAGMRQDSSNEGPEIPWIPTRAVSGETTRLRTTPTEVTTGDTRGRLVQRGDLLLVSRGLESIAPGHLGCVVVEFDGESAFAESLLQLRCDAGIADPDFVRLFLTSRQGHAMLTAMTTGTTIGNLKISALVKARIPLPPLPQQRAMAKAARDMEGAVESLAELLVDSRNLLEAAREAVANCLTRP